MFTIGFERWGIGNRVRLASGDVYLWPDVPAMRASVGGLVDYSYGIKDRREALRVAQAVMREAYRI